VRIVEVSFSEGGNGKDFTDSLVQKQKQMLRYQIVSNPGGSACTAMECVENIAQGCLESGTGGSCDTREITFERSQFVKGAEDKAIAGISSLFFFTYEYDSAGLFFGLRAFAHRGIGHGRFYSAAECARLFSDSGFTEDMEPVLNSASATLPAASASEA
jgi:hypothetical protein